MADQEQRTVGTVEVGQTVEHLSPQERAALGKEARARAPRSSQAEFSPATSRPDPVDLLERQARSRVPELVPIRYGRMLVSPFAFFRGAALVMASDLAPTPRSGLQAQICGDAHLSNFGVFASPERTLMFDVNDFDETLPGPWEWDVKRLAASVVIAARDREFTAKEARTAAIEVGTSYRREMNRLAGLTNLDVWYSRIDVAELLAELEAQAGSTRSKADKRMASRTSKMLTKARTRDSMQALDKLTHVVNGQRRIISDPPLVVPTEELFPQVESDALLESLHRLLRSYRRTLQTDRRHLIEQFELLEMARKVVGVGSVGTRAWILLLVGRDNDDPLFLLAWSGTPVRVPRRWPGATPDPATASPSPRTSGPGPPSTRPLPSSPRPTPTRTSATTKPSSRPLPADGSRRRPVCRDQRRGTDRSTPGGRTTLAPDTIWRYGDSTGGLREGVGTCNHRKPGPSDASAYRRSPALCHTSRRPTCCSRPSRSTRCRSAARSSGVSTTSSPGPAIGPCGGSAARQAMRSPRSSLAHWSVPGIRPSARPAARATSRRPSTRRSGTG